MKRITKQSIPDMLGSLEPEASSGIRKRCVKLLRFAFLLVTSFANHQGQLRAAALTYTTLLSLIPFLAIAFAILKGLGVQNVLEPVLMELAGDSQETISSIISYVNNTNFKSVGAIGLLMLVLTAISLLESIEKAFNTTWGVHETRPLQRRFSDYLSVVVVGPILILVATSMTSSMQNQWMVQWLLQREYFGDALLFLFRLLPYVSIWIALVFLYTFIPNTRVRFRSALLGGVLAGTAWQVAQWVYFHFQVGVANYNAIYGTLAALPIFLVWIYTSWLIVLFGLEIVCAHQNRDHFMSNTLSGERGPVAEDKLLLALLLRVVYCFQNGLHPPDGNQIAFDLAAPVERVKAGLDTLAELGFIIHTDSQEPGWVPARDPASVKVADVLAVLHKNQLSGQKLPAAAAVAEELIQQCQEVVRASLQEISLHDLIATRMGTCHPDGSGDDHRKGISP